ncbi:MAG: SLC13 family permease [Suipraeoptans sp.]
MDIGSISLLILVLVIAVGFFMKINVGILAVLAATILGYGSGLFTGKEIIAGFSSSLFMTLAGVTFLFAIVQENGSLELLIKKIISRIGNFVMLVPLVIFAFGWLVSASGPGLIPTAALVAVIAIPVAHETGFNPIMLSIIGVHAANAGRFTMLTVEGNLITSLLEEQGYTENIMMPLCISVTILSILLSFISYVFYKGYKVHGIGLEKEKVEHEKFTYQQIASLIGMLVMTFLILVMKFEVGLAAFAVATVLIILRACDEKTAIKKMPWSTIMLVIGVGVLMNLVIELGGIDLLASYLSSIMTAKTASALSGLTAGILSWFSSTLGVVIPTLVPTTSTLIAGLGGNVTVLEIVAAIVFASSTAGISPASTAGALIMGACASDEKFSKKYQPDKLFIELFVWAVVGIAVIVILCLFGYFSWFA